MNQIVNQVYKITTLINISKLFFVLSKDIVNYCFKEVEFQKSKI